MIRLRPCEIQVRVAARDDDYQEEVRGRPIELYATNTWESDWPGFLLTAAEAAMLGGLLIAAAGASAAQKPGDESDYPSITSLQELYIVPGQDKEVEAGLDGSIEYVRKWLDAEPAEPDSYVERPDRQGVCGGLIHPGRCGHMSGL
jgi:hypothetical protein